MSGILGGGHKPSKQTSQQATARGPGRHNQMAYDLALNKLVGDLMDPQALNIPKPLSEAISGTEDLLPSLFGAAFGPGRGLAGVLGGGPMAASGSYPTFGRTQTRAELGMNDPRAAAEGFLPPVSDVQANLNRVRVPPEIGKQRRLQGKLDWLKGKQIDAPNPVATQRRIDRTGRRLSRLEGNPKYLEPRASA
jgi:hypothetical protein